jgi:disulfide bond formation protein DsbB
MSSFLRPVLDRWRFFALLASAAMLAAAHAFETFGHLPPCELCLKQRSVYWIAIGVAAVAMVVVRLPGGPRWRELSCWLLAMVFLASVGAAGYHAGVEWKFWPGPQACSGSSRVTLESLQALLNAKTTHVVRCDEPAWIFLGLSMAGWNTLVSLGLTGASVLAARRERAKA